MLGRYQVFVHRGQRAPKYAMPWHWLASLTVAFLCTDRSYCRIVDSKTNTTLMEWERLSSVR